MTRLRQTANLLRDTTPAPLFDQLGASLESTVAIQMTAYPDHWTDAERRELAERHLFGPRNCDLARVELLVEAMRLLIDLEAALILTADHGGEYMSVADFVRRCDELKRVQAFFHENQDHPALKAAAAGGE